MDIKSVIEEISLNYREIDSRLSDMDLELLPGIMMDRTRLIEDLARDLECGAVPEAELQSAVGVIRDQNFRLEVRIADRVSRARTELDELYRLSKRSDAYGGEAHRAAGEDFAPSKEYC